MDRLVSRERDSEIDIEGGGANGIFERIENSVSANGRTEKILNRVSNGHSNFGTFENSENEAISLIVDKNLGERSSQNLELTERKGIEEYCNKNLRKPSKPPRPPRGPSLSDNDQKLVREIAKLAIRKRARIEHMRSLRKMKAAKASSSRNSAFAMIVTILFFIIIIFQGLFARSSATLGSDGSPAPAVSANEGLISVQFYDFALRERNNTNPNSFRYLEKLQSGADPEQETETIAR